MTEADRIAETIRERLEALGESVSEVEQRAGLPKDYIADVLAGDYAYLQGGQVVSIAGALGLSEAELRGEEPADEAALTYPRPAAEVRALNPATELSRLRASIDNIDAAVIHMLAERFKQTKAVGELKAVHGLPPADKTREAQQIERLRRLANDADLDPDFAEAFLNFIVTEVIRHHEKLQGKG
jgi:chorismate mutase